MEGPLDSAAMQMGRITLISVSLFLALVSVTVLASDPELTADFAAPAGVDPKTLDGSFFTSKLLENVQIESKSFATVTPVNSGNFPALTGLGVSSALVQFPQGSVNAPHTHPRGTEVLFIIQGVLDVGLVDAANNKLFTQTLKAGDLFVFPKGLVHFQINRQYETVQAVAAFSSSAPGLIRLPINLFKSGIADDVLQKSFGVSQNVIQELKKAIVTRR